MTAENIEFSEKKIYAAEVVPPVGYFDAHTALSGAAFRDSAIDYWPAKAEFPNVISFDVNQRITKRLIYAYVYASPLAYIANPIPFHPRGAWFACEVVFYLANRRAKAIPLFLASGKGLSDYKLLPTPVLTGITSGGIAGQDSKMITIRDPIQNGGYTPGYETDGPVLLQPIAVDVQCDRIALNVIGWSNYEPGNGGGSIGGSRFILIAEDK